MWYAFLDGDICFWTFAKSQKVVNLRRDPRITCLVETGDEYAQLRGVELIARAEIIEDETEVLRFGIAETERYQNVKVNDAMIAGITKMANKRVIVKLVIEKLVSWDHRKLGGGY
jgi:general stress protein 26